MLYKGVICIFCIFEFLLQMYSKTTGAVKLVKYLLYYHWLTDFIFFIELSYVKKTEQSKS